jgi:hypothetical protein
MLRRQRLAASLTQEALAEQAAVSSTAVAESEALGAAGITAEATARLSVP